VGTPSYKEPDTDDDEFNSASEEGDGEGGHSSGNTRLTDHDALSANQDKSFPEFMHGRCSTVNILFDNQKVRELQYSMEDFGSEESDSDEEWDGDFEDDEHLVVF
jgi:hypothetical protein